MQRARTRTKYPGIYERDGRYQVVYRDRYGKQRSKTLRTLAEAKRFQAEAVSSKSWSGKSDLTLNAYAEQWFETYQGRTKRGLRPNSLRVYRIRTEQHILPAFGRMRLADIKPQDVKTWSRQLAKLGLSPDYSSGILKTFRTILSTACEDGLIDSNPAQHVRFVSEVPWKEAAGREKALSDVEVEALLEHAMGFERDLYRFLLETGLRIGEAIGLNVSDVQGCVLRVQTQQEGAPLKTENAYRTLALSSWSQAWLIDLCDNNAGLSVPLLRESPQNFNRLRYRELHEQLKGTARRAGITGMHFHRFRHTCATRLFRAGANPKQVQQWLGHASFAYTMDQYVHVLPDDQLDSAFLDRVNSLGNGSGQQGGKDAAEIPVNGDVLLSVESPHIPVDRRRAEVA